MQSPKRALEEWNIDLPLIESPDQGLIGSTWIVGNPPQYVLQWVNPILVRSSIKIFRWCSNIWNRKVHHANLIPTRDGSPCWVEETDAGESGLY